MFERAEALHARRGTVRRRPRRALYIAVAGLIILLALHSLWLPFIGRLLIVADPLPAQPVDAVVPLAGDRIRVWYGARLFSHDRARWFVLTNMKIDSASPPLTYAGLVREQALEHGIPEERILIVPEAVGSTYAEALQIRHMAQRQGWRSLIVVTSPSHTRRARLILREVFDGTGITIIVRPVLGHWYTPETWWKDPDARREIGSEYLKLALYLIGYHMIWKG